MQITKLRMKNIKSIGGKWVSIDFSDSGLHLTKGVPGTGKTTVLSSITYALFGKSTDFKGTSKSTLPTSGLINDINKKEMVVELYLDNGYTIIRGQKPDIFQILDKDNKDIAEYSSKRIDQEFLEQNVLNGLTLDIFMNTIYLSSKPQTVPFVYMSNVQRKDYIEKILDLSIINNMNEHLKSHISTNKLEINSLSTEKILLEQQKEMEERKYQEAKFNYENDLQKSEQFLINKERRLLDCDYVITSTKEDIENKQKDIVQITKELEILKDSFSQENSRFDLSSIKQFKEEAVIQKEKLQNYIISLNESISNFDKDSIHNELEQLEEIKAGLLFKKEMILIDIENFTINEFPKSEYLECIDSKDKLTLDISTFKDNITELKNHQFKKQTELDTYIDNKSRYHECGECPTLSKIIGSYSISDSKSFIDKCSEIISETEAKLGNSIHDLSLVQKSIDKLNELSMKIDKEKEEYKELVRESDTLSQNIQINESKLSETKKDIINKKESYSSQILLVQEKLKSFDIDFNNTLQNMINSIYTKYTNLITEISNEIQRLQRKIESDSILKIEIEQSSYNIGQEPKNSYILEVQDKLSNCLVKYDDIYNKGVELDNLKKIINDKEHKAKALESILPIFENKLNSLLDRFLEDDEFAVTAKIQNDFELIFFKNGKVFNLFSLSAGQQQCVSLASTFSFMYLLSLRSNNNFNHIFIDEILDMSLGSRGPLIIRYLKELSDSKNVYVISHNTSLPFELFNSITTVQKQGNFTVYSKED